MKILSNFLLFPIWVQRLLIVGTILPLMVPYDGYRQFYNMEAATVYVLMYWGTVLAVSWIYAGTKTGK